MNHKFVIPASDADQLASVGGIVLAGSYQWSSSSFEQLRVRPLLPVAGRPLIEHVLNWFGEAGVQDAIVCGNGSSAALKQHLGGSRTGAPSLTFLEDHGPRGAAGCVKDAARGSGARTFVVADGASIPTVNLGRLVAHHRATKAAVTMVVYRAGNDHLEPTGTYVFESEVLASVPATSFQDIKEALIPRLYREGRQIEVFLVEDVSPRVLNVSSYLAINRWAIERLLPHGDEPVRADNRSPELVASATAWVDKDAVIVGPVVLGDGVRIHASAMIIGPTVLGAGTVVGAGAVVTRSVVLNNCTIGENVMVDQCVLADEAVVEPKTTLTGVFRCAGRPRSLLATRLVATTAFLRGSRAVVRQAVS